MKPTQQIIASAPKTRISFRFFLLLFLYAGMNAFGQDNLSHVFFCNQTRLDIRLDTFLLGNTGAVFAGKLDFLPFEITHDHYSRPGDPNQPLTVKDHNEANSSLRCVRSRNGGANTFQAELAVSSGTDLLFTILIRSVDTAGFSKTRLFYNIRYADGSLENPDPGLWMRDDNPGQVQVARTIAYQGREYKLVYGMFNEKGDVSDNIIYSLSSVVDSIYRYDPPLSDTANPNVINAYCYNPGILMPLGLSDQDEDQRATVLYKAMPKNMDVIIFQEFFEPQKVAIIARDLAPYYPYHTGPHNRILIPVIGKDGGVRIFSKYPILEEREVSFSENGCVPDDLFALFANKGVKYAKISKQGQIIHVFGTHTSLQPCDLYVMGEFMAQFDIGKDDIVIMGGDYNVDMNHLDQGSDDYTIMLDTLNALEPTYTMFLNDRSYKGTTSGLNHFYCCNPDGRQHLDYIFACAKYKIPYLLTNRTQQARLNEPDESFGIFDMGDHEPVYARLEFPYFSVRRATRSACIGESVTLHTSVSAPAGGYYQWYRGESPLPGAMDTTLDVTLTDESDFGTYTCRYHYQYLPDTTINDFFDPAYMQYEWYFRGITLASIDAVFDVVPADTSAACSGVLQSVRPGRITPFRLFPNPARDVLELRADTDLSAFEFRLTDLTGRAMQLPPIGGGPSLIRFDISGLSDGMYLFSATLREEVYSQSFVKQ